MFRKYLLPVLMIIFCNSFSYAQWVRTSLQSTKDINYLASKDSLLAACAGDTVFYSIDEGNTWISFNNGLEGRAIYSLAFIGPNIIAGTDSGIFISRGDSTWIRTDGGNAVGMVVSLVTKDSCIFAGIYSGYPTSGVIRSTDSGQTWEKADSGLTDLGVRVLSIFDSSIYVGTNFTGIFRSTNNGANWELLPLGSYDVRSITSNDSFMFVGTNSGVFRSGDHGITWSAMVQDLPDTNFTNCYGLAITAFGPNIFYIPFDGHIYFSTNNGQTWTNTNPHLNIYNASVILIQNDYVFACGSYGVWRRNLSDMITAINFSSLDYPDSYILKQNYPNPFNPITTISFSLPTTTFVSLKVFDVLGRLISVLINDELHTGNFSIDWDANNFQSGVYICRLQVGSLFQTKKMILLR